MSRHMLFAFCIHQQFKSLAKGGEWTVSTGWNDQFINVCDWFGVKCNNETKQPTRLELNNNGLSGKLSDTFGVLRSLEYIDLVSALAQGCSYFRLSSDF
jgi:hypothetical protein